MLVKWVYVYREEVLLQYPIFLFSRAPEKKKGGKREEWKWVKILLITRNW